ncbi:MAG: glycoside hydrolase family 105 protein [Candidatus Cryptobacteroides sp.]
MKKILLCICLSFTILSLWGAEFKKPGVKNIMKLVADWQIEHPNTEFEHGDLDWTNGALYLGMLDWAELTEREDGEMKYYDWLLEIGRRNEFQPGNKMFHADYICVGQTFIELYRKFGEQKMIAPVIARAAWVVENLPMTPIEIDFNHPETLNRWSWCDALFMAPPVYAKLYAQTLDRKYLDFMNREYMATYESLFDKEENLFYRDVRYIGQKEANGRKVFWGRGNGWVLGGLAEILKSLPSDEPSVTFYKDLFVTLATRVAGLQSSDGYWHASLLDPASYPSPETSSTGFIVYALAYGVNAGLLDKDEFMPIVQKGWKALTAAVDKNGKLGYVQPIGADPRKVTREMTEVYGVGAFLLAGCEIYKMAE